MGSNNGQRKQHHGSMQQRSSSNRTVTSMSDNDRYYADKIGFNSKEGLTRQRRHSCAVARQHRQQPLLCSSGNSQSKLGDNRGKWSEKATINWISVKAQWPWHSNLRTDIRERSDRKGCNCWLSIVAQGQQQREDIGRKDYNQPWLSVAGISPVILGMMGSGAHFKFTGCLAKFSTTGRGLRAQRQ